MSPTNNLERAAVLLMYLESKSFGSTAEVLKELDSSVAKEILHYIRYSPPVPSKDLKTVLEGFHREFIETEYVYGGRNIADTMMSHCFGDSIEESDSSSSTLADAFDYLNHKSAEDLMAYFATENDSMSTLCMKYLSETKLAEVFSKMSGNDVQKYTFAMVSMQSPSSQVLFKIQQNLAEHITDISLKAREDGLDTQTYRLATTFEQMADTARGQVLATLQQDSKETYDKICKIMLSFNDLVMMSDKDLQLALSQIQDISQLAKTYEAATPEFQEKIKQNLPARSQERLVDTIEDMGEQDIVDLDAAGLEFLKIARGLEKAGKIDRLRKGE